MTKQDLNDVIGTGLLVQSADEIGLPTLRDRFAIAALTGIIAAPNPHSINGSMAQKPQHIAIVAYDYADAMLEARKANEVKP